MTLPTADEIAGLVSRLRSGTLDRDNFPLMQSERSTANAGTVIDAVNALASLQAEIERLQARVSAGDKLADAIALMKDVHCIGIPVKTLVAIESTYNAYRATAQ